MKNYKSKINSKLQILNYKSLRAILVLITLSMVNGRWSIVKPVFAQGLSSNIESAVLDRGFFNPELGDFVTTIVEFGIIMGAIALLIYILWGGLEWITSGGDPQKYESARKKITYAIFGFAILAAVFLIWRIVLYVSGFRSSDIFTFPELGSGGGSTTSTTTGGAPHAPGTGPIP